MANSEPQPGAPTTVWAGPADAAAYWNSVGMDWAAPIAAVADTRIVDIATLCAGPAPIAPEFGLSDVLAVVTFGQSLDATKAKLHDYVDARMWPQYCRYTDATPPPAPPYQDCPPGVPPSDPNGWYSQDWIPRKLLDMEKRLSWMGSQLATRTFREWSPQEATGIGVLQFDPLKADHNEYEVWPIGFWVDLVASPDYEGVSAPDPAGLHYGLGDVSVGNADGFEHPIKLMHHRQLVYPGFPRTNTFKYNLRAGVTISVTPLYPAQYIGDPLT